MIYFMSLNPPYIYPMKSNLFFLVIFLVASCATPQQIDVTSFTKPDENPILRADSSYVFDCPMKKQPVRWQRADVFNPGAVVKDGKVYMLYRCEDNPAAALGGRTSRIGLAESTDGLHFMKHSTPVLFPDNDDQAQYDQPGGCEDPRLAVTEDGLYVVAYTAWNGQVARLCLAFSWDLIHWEKKGPAFELAHSGRFKDEWSKSGSILTEFKRGKQVIVKVNGKYWMYWGEQLVNLAWSENLHDWTPLLDEKGELKAVIRPRNSKFDSHLTECGPPALLTEEGVVLLYNGKNLNDENADPSLPRGTYSVGQVVLDKQDLQTVVRRSDKPFLQPTLPHEKTGQYQAGTTFAEGLVFFKRKWWLYYGTADSFVGLAVGR